MTVRRRSGPTPWEDMLVPMREVTIASPDGLHMRPAAEFVKTANRFDCTLTVRTDKKAVDGKSILALFELVAVSGTTLRLEAEGDDAEACLTALAGLVAKFNEDVAKKRKR